MTVAWHDSELKRWHVCVSVFMVKKWYFSTSQKRLWILLVSCICFWIGSLMLANRHDGNGEALRSLMRNLSCPAFWGKISTFVVCLYCKCLYMSKYLYLVFFFLSTDCTSSLGRHRGLVQGILLPCKKLCANFQEKSERKSLPEVELAWTKIPFFLNGRASFRQKKEHGSICVLCHWY